MFSYKTSCKKDAAKITNEAIESIANLEYLPAMGMAKAALLLDPECGCAQLALAAISSPNPNWGSQKSKLEAMDVTSLTAEEKAWHGFLMASREDRPAVAQAAQSTDNAWRDPRRGVGDCHARDRRRRERGGPGPDPPTRIQQPDPHERHAASERERIG